jgi:hypothetical protein
VIIMFSDIMEKTLECYNKVKWNDKGNYQQRFDRILSHARADHLDGESRC